jgi:hypothetical protein
MAKKLKIIAGLIIVGAAGAGIKCWLGNQNLDEAKLDDLSVPPPAATPTAFTETPPHREVTATGKDEHGVVASLHGEWGMVSKDEAISDIEAGRASYAVTGGQILVVVDGSTGKYLRSHADGGNADNLDELPNPEAVDPA